MRAILQIYRFGERTSAVFDFVRFHIRLITIKTAAVVVTVVLVVVMPWQAVVRNFVYFRVSSQSRELYFPMALA